MSITPRRPCASPAPAARHEAERAAFVAGRAVGIAGVGVGSSAAAMNRTPRRRLFRLVRFRRCRIPFGVGGRPVLTLRQRGRLECERTGNRAVPDGGRGAAASARRVSAPDPAADPPDAVPGEPNRPRTPRPDRRSTGHPRGVPSACSPMCSGSSETASRSPPTSMKTTAARVPTIRPVSPRHSIPDACAVEALSSMETTAPDTMTFMVHSPSRFGPNPAPNRQFPHTACAVNAVAKGGPVVGQRLMEAASA
jgi:hypothetical protein